MIFSYVCLYSNDINKFSKMDLHCDINEIYILWNNKCGLNLDICIIYVS